MSELPTKERLAQALEEAQAPEFMISKARAGAYDDFESESSSPIGDLIKDATSYHMPDIVTRAKRGDFDATSEEGDAWADSVTDPELRAVIDAIRSTIDAKRPPTKE